MVVMVVSVFCHVLASKQVQCAAVALVMALDFQPTFRQATLRCPRLVGFTNSTDKDRIEAFVQCGVKLCLYHTDLTASQLVEDLDDKLIRTVLYNTQHVLHHLLPNRTDHSDLAGTTALSVRRLT